MRTVALPVLALAFLTVLVAVLSAVSAAGAPVSPAVDGQAVDADTVLMEVDIQESGAAVWTVAYRVRLDSDNETTAFEELQADVRENESRYASAFRERMTGTVDAAADSTDRTMAVENVSVDARIEAVPRSTGVLTYRLTWTGFAASDGDRLIAGDALAGLYLDANTVLTMAWPDGYDAEVAPSGERGNRSVTWYGPLDFGPNEPSVAVAPAEPTPGDPAAESRAPLLAIAAAIVAVVAGLAGAYWWARRNGGDADGSAPMAADAEDRATEATAAETGADAVSDASDTTDATDDGDAGDPADGPPFDQSLLRNDEQVRRLLAANDGRMKQQAIASTLDWTDAKTSQVIGDLREEGAVETFRIGRENVVELTTDGDSEAA